MSAILPASVCGVGAVVVWTGIAIACLCLLPIGSPHFHARMAIHERVFSPRTGILVPCVAALAGLIVARYHGTR
jgi:hypothetical protein